MLLYECFTHGKFFYCLIWISTAAPKDHYFHPSHRNREEITLFFLALAFYVLEDWNVKETSLIKDEE